MAELLTPDEITAYLDEIFPQVKGDFRIEEVRPDGVRMRLMVDDRHLRPGGTVSGPAMFALADVSAYVAVIAHVGHVALAVTTNCSIDFMRKPAAATDLIAECRLLKLGKALAVCDLLIYSEGVEAPVARASLTYSIPPKR